MYFPYSPLVVVESTFAEAVVLETLLLSIYNHDSAVASAASRMTLRRRGPPVHRDGVAAHPRGGGGGGARAAYVAGFAATSNLAARHRYGVPTAGTSAHSFTLLHDTEEDAFRAQVKSLGAGTTLLVDTYDVAEAVRLAVEVAGPELGAVRLDSGDLAVLAREVRPSSTTSGATDTRIVVTSDLDEFAIAALAAAPGRRLRRRHGAGHRQRTPDLRLRLQAGRPRGRPRRGWCRSPRRASTRSRSAAASGRCAGVDDGVARGRGRSASARRRTNDGDDRPLLVAAGPGRRGRRRASRSTPPATGTARARCRAPAGGRADVEGRAGDRDRPRVTRRRPAARADPARSNY